MPKGRKRQASDRPDETQTKTKSRKSNGGEPTLNQGTLCSICNKTIVEGTSENEGEDAIFCEKRCGWLHRGCAGLTNPFFKLFTENDTPFLCIYCMLKSQSDEICALQATVKEMEKTLALIQTSTVTNSNRNNHDYTEQAWVSVTRPTVSEANCNSAFQAVTGSNSTRSHNPGTAQRNINSESDRKFNMIIHGIPETKPGTSKMARFQSDLKSVGSIVSGLNSGVSELSLRDCFRLGKYKKDLQKPRPILAKLNRSTDVLTLLSLKTSLPEGVTFKADLSRQERQAEAILLKERWKLIQSGTDRKSIRIRNGLLFIRGELYCKVVDEKLIKNDETISPLPTKEGTSTANKGTPTSPSHGCS